MSNLSALNHPEGKNFIYFFKGNQYFKYDWKNDQVLGKARPLSSWKGLPPDGIDAAFNHPTQKDSLVFFLKGTTCFLYEWHPDKVVKKGPITDFFPGLPAIEINAVLNHPKNPARYIYFFSKTDYYLYDWQNKALVKGYPKPTHKMWSGYPHHYMDAAVNHPTNSDKVYLFLGSLYFRYDWTSDSVDSNYPKKVAKHWKGLNINSIWKITPTHLKIVKSEEWRDDPYLVGIYWSAAIGVKGSTSVQLLDTYKLLGQNIPTGNTITIPQDANLAITEEMNTFGYVEPHSVNTPVFVMGYFMIGMDRDFAGHRLMDRTLDFLKNLIKTSLEKNIENTPWFAPTNNIPNTAAVKTAIEQLTKDVTRQILAPEANSFISFLDALFLDDVVGSGQLFFTNLDADLSSLIQIDNNHPMSIETTSTNLTLKGVGEYEISFKIERVK